MLVLPECVIPIEFKVGAKKFERLDYEQAWDYGLDLKNFHAPSHAAPIFLILCATEARDSDRRWKPPHADGVRPPFCCNGESLGRAIHLALEDAKGGRERFLRSTPAASGGEGDVASGDSKFAPVPLLPVIGSILGGFLFGLLGLSADGAIGSLVTATVGAIVLIAGLRLINRRRL